MITPYLQRPFDHVPRKSIKEEPYGSSDGEPGGSGDDESDGSDDEGSEESSLTDPARNTSRGKYTLVIVLDGLRSDLITAESMPNLHSFGERGIVCENHHAVFPSKTRVNAATVATGCYPASHGIVHNELFLPAVSAEPLNTGDDATLREIERATGGRALTAVGLGQLLEERDRTLFAAGSGSPGSTMLLNHKSSGAGVFNARGFVSPPANRSLAERRLDGFSEKRAPNTAQNRWAVDAYLDVALTRRNPPDVSVLWISDPDVTMHSCGVGHPRVFVALREIDDELGRIFETLRTKQLAEETNVFVLSDHGFSTNRGTLDVPRILSKHGLEEGVHVVGGTQIFLPGGDERRVERIVRLLQRTDGVGAIFTRPADPSDGKTANGFAAGTQSQSAPETGSRPVPETANQPTAKASNGKREKTDTESASGVEGVISGTFSMELVRVDHDRAPEVLFAPDWDDRENEHGYPGTTSRRGIGGHGTLSPYEMCVHLRAGGPDLEGGGARSLVPTGHVDLAPTILHLLGIRPPATMDGRILHELFVDGPDPDSLTVTRDEVRTASSADCSYRSTLHRSHVAGRDYPMAAYTRRDGA